MGTTPCSLSSGEHAASQRYSVQAIVNSDAVAALPADIRALYPYDDIANYGKKASFFGFPPVEPEGDLTTFSDWLKAYERFKAA